MEDEIIMVIDQELANRFIEQYRDFLLHIYEIEFGENDDGTGQIKKLSAARNCYLADRDKYNGYLDNNGRYDSDIVVAIKSLDVADWAYLRDSGHFSLFVKSNASLGVAVLGLTQPIKDIFGCAGIYMKAGIVRLGNHFTIDGIISDPTKLGEEYEQVFGKAFETIKLLGKFIKQPV
jgi:hypothetical protein